MTVREYKEYLLLEPDEMNEFTIGKIFKLEPKDFKTIEEFVQEVENRLVTKEIELPKDGKIYFNNKWWYWDKDISETSVESWCQMSEILAMKEDVSTRLISIYFRPVGEKFNVKRLDDISEELLDMDVNLYIALNKVFFYQGMKLLNSSRVHYLNQLKKKRKKVNRTEYGKGMVIT